MDEGSAPLGEVGERAGVMEPRVVITRLRGD
jgi:hypothetical protein